MTALAGRVELEEEGRQGALGKYRLGLGLPWRPWRLRVRPSMVPENTLAAAAFLGTYTSYSGGAGAHGRVAEGGGEHRRRPTYGKVVRGKGTGTAVIPPLGRTCLRGKGTSKWRKQITISFFFAFLRFAVAEA